MSKDFTAPEFCQELVGMNSSGLFRDIFPNIHFIELQEKPDFDELPTNFITVFLG